MLFSVLELRCTTLKRQIQNAGLVGELVFQSQLNFKEKTATMYNDCKKNALARAVNFR